MAERRLLGQRTGVSEKREREKAVVSQMIALYCRKRHHGKDGLCPKCAELADYARHRTDLCPYMESKTIFYHPVLTVRHVTAVLAEKRRIRRSEVFHPNKEKQ